MIFDIFIYILCFLMFWDNIFSSWDQINVKNYSLTGFSFEIESDSGHQIRNDTLFKSELGSQIWTKTHFKTSRLKHTFLWYKIFIFGYFSLYEHMFRISALYIKIGQIPVKPWLGLLSLIMSHWSWVAKWWVGRG